MAISDVSGILAQIRDYQTRVGEQPQIQPSELRQQLGVNATQINTPSASNFNDVISRAFMDSMRQVNQLQDQSSALMTRFEMGEDIELTDLVMSMQKSSLAFEATLQVRNKVLKAYEDIMNMPV
jgi:flagellar hook-basal body complex protein FliE